MTDRYDADDTAFEESTGILRNNLGITDPDRLKEAEAAFVAARALEGLPPGGLDFEHLRAIHHHLFQDVYPWAGDIRGVQMAKGSSRFASPAFILQESDKLLSRLAAENHLQRLSLEAFSRRAAHYVNELNAIHPFREGNGRAIRAFLTVLAEQAGFALNAKHLSRKAWLNASIKGFNASHEAMAELIGTALSLSIPLGTLRDLPTEDIRYAVAVMDKPEVPERYKRQRLASLSKRMKSSDDITSC